MSHAYSKPTWSRLGCAGVTTLEFAIVAGLFLMLLFGCMDLGRYYLIEHSLRTMVAETARYALSHPSLQGAVDPAAASFTTITPFIVNSATLTVQQQAGMPGINQINVTATYQFTPISPLWHLLRGQITDNMPLQY
jgi:Flp pilus assembly protein TadG